MSTHLNNPDLAGMMIDMSDKLDRIHREIATIRGIYSTIRKAKQFVLPETTFRKIIGAVCRNFDLSEEELISRRNFQAIVLPRQIAMLLCREHGMSLMNIGYKLHKHHTTVLYGIVRAEYIAENDSDMRLRIERLRSEIGQ